MQLCDFNKRQMVSPATRKQSRRLFHKLRNGQKVFRRLMNGYQKVNVGPFWRILSKDGERWWLMDHETYNREIRK